MSTTSKIEPIKLDKPTTGCKDADRRINEAVNMALLRITPILRDVLREEIKRHLPLEEDDDQPKTA